MRVRVPRRPSIDPDAFVKQRVLVLYTRIEDALISTNAQFALDVEQGKALGRRCGLFSLSSERALQALKC